MNGSGREIHYRDTTGNGDYRIKLVNEQINDSDKTITIPNATGTVMLNTVDDTTPQLGGALDGQNNNLNNIGTIDGANLQLDFGSD